MPKDPWDPFYSNRPHFAWQPMADVIILRSTSRHSFLQQTENRWQGRYCGIQWFSSVNCWRRDLCDGKNGAITLDISDCRWCSTSDCSSSQIYSSREWKVNLPSNISLNKIGFLWNAFVWNRLKGEEWLAGIFSIVFKVLVQKKPCF